MRYAKIGGQAVIEGVMMRCGDDVAVAVRKPDHEIEVKKEHRPTLNARLGTAKIPIVRGAVSFIDSLVIGMSTLTYSASFYEDEEENDRTPAEKNEKADKLFMGLTVAFSVVVAVALFMLTPFLLSTLFGRFIKSALLLSALEGLFRIMIFLAYMILISQMKDIQRVFMYHGAEHKTINCIEAGMELTPENAAGCSRLHKRCGTSFLLIVMVISIICFMFIRTDSMALRLLSRVLLVPVIAGISFEIIQWAGRSTSALVNIVSGPGLMLQHLTTREPDLEMLEVAIHSIEAIYDWRSFQEEGKEAGCEGTCVR